MADVTVSYLADRLGLSPLPEGGMGVKVYTHRQGSTVFGETGYVLVTSASPQHLYRLSGDQTWHFLEGSGARQLVLLPDGGWHCYELGRASEGKKALSIVPGGCWQAVQSEGWALFSVFRPSGTLSMWDGSLASCWQCPELARFGGVR